MKKGKDELTDDERKQIFDLRLKLGAWQRLKAPQMKDVIIHSSGAVIVHPNTLMELGVNEGYICMN